MARQPKKDASYSDLPVLTELSETSAHIPVLTEELAEEAPPPPPQKTITLTEAEYQELAAQLATQLEAILSEKFARSIEAIWLESWQETRKKLPELIRAQLAAQKRPSSK